MKTSQDFCRKLGIEIPVLGGAMYPCSNPELVAAVSEAGGIGIIQPLSLTYVWGHSFRDGIKLIRSLTKRPIGMNVLLEKSSRTYERRMSEWVDIALEEGCKFFVSALGNPTGLVKKVHAANAIIFHDVTEKKWALKAQAAQVDGFICVNRRAGGHAGHLSAEELSREISPFGLPMICAGGIGDEGEFQRALSLGYIGAQIGTRLIATPECKAPEEYKRAILGANEDDIVLTERVTGIPLSVIRTEEVMRVGTKASALARWLLKQRFSKEWMRLIYNLRALVSMKRSVRKGFSTKDYWQAGKSVAQIQKIEPVATIFARFRNAAKLMSP